MLNITRKVEYALIALRHMQSKNDIGLTSAKEIAAQYGIPSIGGKDGGASDAIEHDKTGLICDGNNLEEIYSSIDLGITSKNNLFALLGL